mmetsp:Transcript_26971/g.34619  ORF Transcript_26971/g.34619 Transcript_26971/m.34619 type:complete len:188 (+) Transcript_26971:1227-1790(+)
MCDAVGDFLGCPVAAFQREGEVLAHGFGRVNHGKLEDLRDVARRGARLGDVFVVEQKLPVGGFQQARNDVEHGGFATARRAEQRICFAVFPDQIDGFERIIIVAARGNEIGMAKAFERDFGHQSALSVMLSSACEKSSSACGSSVTSRRVPAWNSWMPSTSMTAPPKGSCRWTMVSEPENSASLTVA